MRRREPVTPTQGSCLPGGTGGRGCTRTRDENHRNHLQKEKPLVSVTKKDHNSTDNKSYYNNYNNNNNYYYYYYSNTCDENRITIPPDRPRKHAPHNSPNDCPANAKWNALVLVELGPGLKNTLAAASAHDTAVLPKACRAVRLACTLR
jgi:hypothetical protein